MKTTKEYLDQLFERLADAAQGLLLLDYDGTLAPFHPKRDEATPYPGIPAILKEIQNSPRTRMVIISGRAVDDIIPLLGLEKLPEIWGSHGWERLGPDGSRERFPVKPEFEEALKAAEKKAADLSGALEKKPACLALHWRGLTPPEVEKLEQEIKMLWGPIAQDRGLELNPFDGGMELRVPGRNKGKVVEDILRTVGSPNLPAVYLGDDLTDEDAFAALEGRGLRVLVRKEDRPTRADCRIEPPGELIAFLERWRDAMAKTN